ncbi:MAG: hypothetical protein U5L09_07145 [Bacteroidales bacterium]|nr:hypothetical protein [Bacteroidales bacterium]
MKQDVPGTTDDVTIEVTGTALATEILPDNQTICSDENITLNTTTEGGAEDYDYSWTSDRLGSPTNPAR